MEKVKDNIFVETGFLGCNPSFVLTSGGIVLIDTPQKPDEAFRWRKEISNYGNIALIINTDHHQDHAIGNYFIEGDIVMHEGTKERLLQENMIQLFKDWVKRMEPRSAFLMDHYFPRHPKFTYTDKMSVYLGGEVFELIHVTSHTQDETIVYMPRKKVLFTGDTLCTNGLPGLHESYPKEWLNALESLEELDFEVLVPGHGEIGNKRSLSRFRNELGNLFERVEEQIRQGLGKEEIVRETRYEDTVHADYPPEFSETFDQMIKKSVARVYDMLREIHRQQTV